MKARVLDAPSWDSRGSRMAVLLQNGDKTFIKIFARSGEQVSALAEYPLPWRQVGEPHFSLQPVGEPQWVDEYTVALRVRTSSSQAQGKGDVVLWDMQHKENQTVAKEVAFFQVDPSGSRMICYDKGEQPFLLHLSDGAVSRFGLDQWFTIRPFFFWNPAGSRVAFQARYTPPREGKFAYSPGSYIVVAEMKGEQVSLRYLRFEELRLGYNTYGVGWWDNNTILFGVDEMQLKQGEMVLNPPTQFVLYKVAADGSQNRPQKLWEPDPKVRPMGGPLFWFNDGGMAYPIGREGRDYVVYFPKERKLKHVRFPEATWIYSTTPQGDLLTVVNKERDKVYAASVGSGRVVLLRL